MEIKRITVGELLRDFGSIELPVIVTRYGKDYCYIASIEDIKLLEDKETIYNSLDDLMDKVHEMGKRVEQLENLSGGY